MGVSCSRHLSHHAVARGFQVPIRSEGKTAYVVRGSDGERTAYVVRGWEGERTAPVSLSAIAPLGRRWIAVLTERGPLTLCAALKERRAPLRASPWREVAPFEEVCSVDAGDADL